MSSCDNCGRMNCICGTEQDASALLKPDGLRPEVLAFAYAMEAQLRANDHKPGWEKDEPCALQDRMMEEAEELEREVSALLEHHPDDHPDRPANVRRVLKEAADVANFCMMIADVCGALKCVPSKREAFMSRLAAMTDEDFEVYAKSLRA